jgi:hypothetical protein
MKQIINSIETSLADISIRTDGILELRFKTGDYEVEVDDMLEIEQVMLKLTNYGELSFHILVIPGLRNSITKEAREMEMFESKAYKNQKSIAIVVHSLAQRLLGTLFFSLKKHKPKFPYKLFGIEENAMTWIQKFDMAKVDL